MCKMLVKRLFIYQITITTTTTTTTTTAAAAAIFNNYAKTISNKHKCTYKTTKQ